MLRGISEPESSSQIKDCETANRAVDATLCSLELLQEFKKYLIPVPKINEHYDSNNTNKEYKNIASKSLSKRNSKQNFGDLFKTTFIPSDSDDNNNREYDHHQNDDLSNIEMMPLKIHIGMAMGELCHIIVGLPNLKNDSSANEHSSKQNINGRLEYCISGPVVQEAGDLLGFAKSGEVAFSKNCWITVKKEIEKSFINIDKNWDLMGNHDDLNGTVPGSVLKTSMANKSQKKSFGRSIHNGILINQEEKDAMQFADMLQTISVSSNKGEGDFSRYLSSPQLELTSLAYIEESLAKYIFNSSGPTDESRDYNQIRSIVSVFIRFPSLDVSSFSNPETLEKANRAVGICLEETRKQGGCCRQFGCDDKAATILLVWGMEGYAHERGEADHAVAAALEISKGLKSIFGKEFSIGIASGSV